MFGTRIFGGGASTAESLQRAYSPLKRIEAYWQSLRDVTPQGDGLPMRAEMDPRGIGTDLGHAFILERIAPGVFKIRVAGCLLTEMMGGQAHGLPFSRAFGRDAHDALAKVLQETCDRPAIARVSLAASRIGLQAGCVGEMRLFPLRPDAHGTARLLGALAFAGRISPPPQPMALTGSFLRSLRRARACPQQDDRLRPTDVPYLRVVQKTEDRLTQ
ncbi:MAG: PAS domain-containing protein [Rhodobacteraceae bacterium]|nr:PAS domain-containing protein [Paracoccaceae bacterium]